MDTSILFRRPFTKPKRIDRTIIDGFVDANGWIGRNAGGLLRQVQTGQLQAYGVVTSLGILVIIGIYLFLR